MLLLSHIAFYLLYAVFLSQIILQLISDDRAMRAALDLLLFGMICQSLFWSLYSVKVASYAEYRSEIKNAVRSKNFTAREYFKRYFLKDCLLKTAVYAAFLLTYTLSFMFGGTDFAAVTYYRNLFVAESGAYYIAGYIPGFVICTLYFFVLFTLARYVCLCRTWKNISSDLKSLN